MKNIYQIIITILLFSIVALPLHAEYTISLQEYIAPNGDCRANVYITVEGNAGPFDVVYDGVYQYGSDWVKEKACRQDGVAAQARIRNLAEGKNAYISIHIEKYEGIRDFLNAHFMKNYGWILDELNEQDEGYINPR